MDTANPHERVRCVAAGCQDRKMKYTDGKKHINRARSRERCVFV